MKNKKIAMFINDLKTNMSPRTCFKGMKNNICKILKQVQNDKYYLKIVCSLSGPTLTIEIGTSRSSSRRVRYFLQFSGNLSYSLIPEISCPQPL